MQINLTDEQIRTCHAMGIPPKDYAYQLESDRIENIAALKTQGGLGSMELEVCRAMGISPKDYLQNASECQSETGVASCNQNYSPGTEAEIAELVSRYTVIR